MKILLVIVAASLSFLPAHSRAGGTYSTPQTRGWVEFQGELYPAEVAAKKRAEWEARTGPTTSTAEMHERVGLRDKYIARFGERNWKTFGAWKSTDVLRRELSALAVVAVVGTAVGVSDSAEAATVRMKDADGNIVNAGSRTDAGKVSSSFRPAASGNTSR